MNIVELRYADFVAKINADKGANCISLRNVKHNCSILREPDYEQQGNNPYLYGMPILFPVNRISGGSFIFEGRTYTLPINEPATNCFLHGTLSEMPFDILEQTENQVLLSYKATKERPYLTFPHEFEIRMKYSLDESGLLQEVTVCNHSCENMPVFLGFHTTFNIPFVRGSQNSDMLICVDCAEEHERNMSTYLPTGNILPHDTLSKQLTEGTFVLDQSVSRHYRAGKDGTISITDTRTGLTMQYENCKEFGYRLVFSNSTEFICLEPQTCIANCANAPFDREEVGFQFIKPNEEKRYWSAIRIK